MFIGLHDIDQGFKDRMFYWRAKINKLHNLFRVRDHWVDFALYWMIFDAYLTKISRKDQDGERLSYFFNNEHDFKKCIQEQQCWQGLLSPYIKKLKEKSPTADMRPNKGEPVYLNDENSVKEVFNFIYQIRCNLFHGAKNIKDPKNDALVFNAAKFMEGSFEYIDKWQDTL